MEMKLELLYESWVSLGGWSISWTTRSPTSMVWPGSKGFGGHYMKRWASQWQDTHLYIPSTWRSHYVFLPKRVILEIYYHLREIHRIVFLFGCIDIYLFEMYCLECWYSSYNHYPFIGFNKFLYICPHHPIYRGIANLSFQYTKELTCSSKTALDLLTKEFVCRGLNQNNKD